MPQCTQQLGNQNILSLTATKLGKAKKIAVWYSASIGGIDLIN